MLFKKFKITFIMFKKVLFRGFFFCEKWYKKEFYFVFGKLLFNKLLKTLYNIVVQRFKNMLKC